MVKFIIVIRLQINIINYNQVKLQMNRKLLTSIARTYFTTGTASALQYSSYFLLRLEYGPDGYYETYEHRKIFQEQVKAVQNEQKGRVLGGDCFPKKATTLLFNCNSVSVPEQFAKKCVYNAKNFVVKTEVTELDKISGEKFEKIWNFYQPKLK